MSVHRVAASFQWSRSRWVPRVGLALVLGVAGWSSVTESLAWVIRKNDLQRAHGLAASDGRIGGLVALQGLRADASAADLARSTALARIAFRREPTSIAAVLALGISAQQRGDTAGAKRLLAYAQTLSRRDLQTELWSIEDAVARQDVDQALRHYDIALRTSGVASSLLFPILSAAIGDVQVRSALIKTLGDKPAWARAFLDYVAIRGPDVQATSDLLTRVRANGGSVSPGAWSANISGLIQQGRIDRAWETYARLRPSADRRRSRDPNFTQDIRDPLPFDWQLLADGGISTSFQKDGRASAFVYSVPSSVGGPLLQQQQALSPGRYVIEGRTTAIDASKQTGPDWSLLCLTSGRELGRVPVPPSSTAKGHFVGTVEVPANCPLQQLRLVVRPSDAPTGLTGQIDAAQIAPAN